MYYGLWAAMLGCGAIALNEAGRAGCYEVTIMIAAVPQELFAILCSALPCFLAPLLCMYYVLHTALSLYKGVWTAQRCVSSMPSTEYRAPAWKPDTTVACRSDPLHPRVVIHRKEQLLTGDE